MFSSLDISILVHATEDENKILNHILENFRLSTNVVKIDRVKTEGHWKNPILRLIISTSSNIERLYTDLCNQLRINYGSEDLDKYLKNNLDEKGSIYIRLDKQKLCAKALFLSDTDAVRMIFKKKGKFEK
ncbi:MAG TPA: RNA-binding domain-containing protein [Candidatus Nitrosocosmicus sp.]|nr:RNA-binding domain-containing protein [Candidatus Nitrosocosmicus sp.]